MKGTVAADRRKSSCGNDLFQSDSWTPDQRIGPLSGNRVRRSIAALVAARRVSKVPADGVRRRVPRFEASRIGVGVLTQNRTSSRIPGSFGVFTRYFRSALEVSAPVMWAGPRWAMDGTDAVRQTL